MSKKSAATELKLRHCVDLEWERFFYVSVKVGKGKDLGGGLCKTALGCEIPVIRLCCCYSWQQIWVATKAIFTLQLSMFLDIIQMEVRVRTLMSDVAELNMKQC